VNGVETTIGNPSLTTEAHSLFVKNEDVYIVGFEWSSSLNICKAMLWKNNIPIVLSNNTSSIAQANSVFVVGNDIYIVGYEFNTTYNINIAKLWKKGIETNITNGTAHAFLSSVYV
jgi:hypothetical protein